MLYLSQYKVVLLPMPICVELGMQHSVDVCLPQSLEEEFLAHSLSCPGGFCQLLSFSASPLSVIVILPADSDKKLLENINSPVEE